LSWAEITKFFDAYNRVARIYPGIIAFAPVVWSASAFGFTPDLRSGGFALLVVACLLYFFASLARSRGKILEETLIRKWGAWPTTLFLRHRDEHFDKMTKGRYHATLAKLCKLAFPSAADEQRDPRGADDVYRSATKKLIEARRGPQFKMLHDENTSYGFRRNLLGLKPISLVIGALAAFATGMSWWLSMPTPMTVVAAFAAFKSAPLLGLLFVIDVGYLLLIAIVVRESFVFQAAKEYTDALFRTLDAPATPRA
jgi:hypothetical protein